jgi:hypothetical protein
MQAQQKQRPRPSIPAYKDGTFQERPGEFDKLLGELGNIKHGAPRIALVGMGGRGKSRLAYEIVQRLKDQDSFPDGTFWMTPHTANNLPLFSDDQSKIQAWKADFAQFAVNIEYLPAKDDETSQENTGRRAHHICDYLASLEGALIVFDDVEDPQFAVKALPEIAGHEARCAILYTSRQRNIPEVPYGAPVYLYQVEKLPDKAAHNLLLEKRPELLETIKSDENGIEASAAHAILEVVENLPLTLLLLRSLLQRDEYLSLTTLAEELNELGQVGIFDAGRQAKVALQRVFELSWKRIESEDAKRLLQLMSYYPRITAIPMHLLGITMGKEEKNFSITRPLGYARVHLQELSLVETLSPEEVRLHPLIRELVQEHIELDDDKGKSLRENAIAHLCHTFTNLNNLAKRAQYQGYWGCLDLVKAASRYARRRGFQGTRTSRTLVTI